MSAPSGGPTAVATPPIGIPAVTPTPTWLNSTQVAERAGTHPCTIRRAAVTAELHGHQPMRNGRPLRKGKWLFHTDAADAWLRGQDVRAQAIACGCATLPARRRTS